MKQERFSEEKIVGILREAEKGEKPVAELMDKPDKIRTMEV